MSLGKLNNAQASTGLKTALEKGVLAAIALLGTTDGFLGNPKVRIPLPGYLEDAAKLLKNFGQGKRIDELTAAINRAAEAVPDDRRERKENPPGPGRHRQCDCPEGVRGAEIKHWGLERQGLKLYFLPPYSPELNRIEKLWHKMKYEWMAFKSRNAKTLEADVDEILAGFGERYKLDFC